MSAVITVRLVRPRAAAAASIEARCEAEFDTEVMVDAG